MFALFIVMLMFSTFIGKCDAADPNSVEKMMIRVCIEMLGITGKRGRIEKKLPIKTAWHGVNSLYGDKAPLEDAIRLHILLKVKIKIIFKFILMNKCLHIRIYLFLRQWLELPMCIGD